MVIYKLTFPNNKVYIGQTSRSLSERWKQHCHDHKFPYKKSRLYTAWKKYGTDSIKLEVLAEATSIEELNSLEQEFIKLCKSTDIEYGYNLKSGGSNGKWNEASKKAFSESKKGIKTHSDEFYKELGKKQSGSNNPMYGKIQSVEGRERLRQARLGTKSSESTIKKISNGRVLVINETTKEENIFNSCLEASKVLNIDYSSILRRFRGQSKTNLFKHYKIIKVKD